MKQPTVNVLVVEDDPNLGTLLKEYLEAKGYHANLEVNGQKGLEAFTKGNYDICVLDVMMPVKDGFTLAKEIRKLDKTVPIVFLTAKSMKEDTLEGFRSGADDYMTKPFSMEELLARLTAILRRTKGTDDKKTKHIFTVGDYTFDYRNQTLSNKAGSTKLTGREADMLKLFCQNPNEVIDRSAILTAIWEDDNYFTGRSMDVYITRLRKYLKEDNEIQLLNVHGKGFKLALSN